jgi:hypothetical protein
MLTMMAIVSALCGGLIISILILAALVNSLIEVLKEAKDALLDPEWWKQWSPAS